MNKIWKPSEPGSDRLIAIQNNHLHKANPTREDLMDFDLNHSDIEKVKGIFSIPFRYIDKVINQQGTDHFKVFFRGSEEEFTVKNESLKNEIFQRLKEELALNYTSGIPGVVEYARKPLLAILVLSVFFILVMFYALDPGFSLVPGSSRRFTLDALAEGLANFGITKIIITYTVLMVICLFSLRKKLKSRSEIEILSR